MILWEIHLEILFTRIFDIGKNIISCFDDLDKIYNKEYQHGDPTCPMTEMYTERQLEKE
jgi:hypothetical protein